MQTPIAIVTGAAGGLGTELCKLIAGKGVKLVLLDRSLQKSQALAAELNRIYPDSVLESFPIDLTNHADIRATAAQVAAKYPVIHFLFNNAGVLTESLQFSAHGNELHFEVNTLAPLQLIDHLRPTLKAADGAVICNTSAGLALAVKELKLENLIHPTEFKKLYGPYVKSKQALNVISAALGDELGPDHISIRSADPGPNRTRLTKGAGTPLWMRLFYALLPSPAKGAKKIFDVAFQEPWHQKTGIVISNGKSAPLPPELADKGVQADLLAKCRQRAALP